MNERMLVASQHTAVQTFDVVFLFALPEFEGFSKSFKLSLFRILVWLVVVVVLGQIHNGRIMILFLLSAIIVVGVAAGTTAPTSTAVSIRTAPRSRLATEPGTSRRGRFYGNSGCCPRQGQRGWWLSKNISAAVVATIISGR